MARRSFSSMGAGTKSENSAQSSRSSSAHFNRSGSSGCTIHFSPFSFYRYDVMRVFALQPLFTAILAYGLFIAAPPLYAQNKYDVLARTLQPYGSLFHSKALTKAVQVDLILREGPPLAAQILNQPLRVTLQMPNKLRIETIVPHHRRVLGKKGQRVGVYPRASPKSIPIEEIKSKKGT